jgi:hypothetical protein
MTIEFSDHDALDPKDASKSTHGFPVLVVETGEITEGPLLDCANEPAYCFHSYQLQVIWQGCSYRYDD